MTASISQAGQRDGSDSAPHSKPAAFFESLYETFRQAVRAAQGPVDHDYEIGACAIRCRFAGPAMVSPIESALDHLTSEPTTTPGLTICLWDSASTGTEMPPPPWCPDDYIARGEVHGYSDARFHTVFDLGTGILSMLDTKRNLALYWIRDARQVAYYESAAPLRTILHRWMRTRGRQLVHAGAVGTPAGGVLLAGKGGSGKSTTALACVNGGFAYVSDDYCLLASGPGPAAFSLYNTAKVDADGIRRFPQLAPETTNPGRLDTEKAVLYLARSSIVKTARSFPVRAVLLPRICGTRETTLQETSHAEGSRELAASTLFQLPGAGEEDLKNIASFVRQVPCYVLNLGTDIARIPPTVLELL